MAEYRLTLTGDEVQSALDRGDELNDLASGKIPTKEGGAIVASSLEETEDRLLSSKALEVPPNTIYIGEGSAINAAIRAINFRSDVTGNTGLFLAQIYDQDGFQRAFAYEGGPAQDFVINDPAGSDVSDEADFLYTAARNALILSITIPTERISQDVYVSYIIRSGGPAGDIAVEVDDTFATDATGNVFIDLREKYSPILIDVGSVIDTQISCPGMIGVQDGGTFTPNIVLNEIEVTRKTLVYEGEAGADALADLSDVELAAPLAGELLSYDDVLAVWKNAGLGSRSVTEFGDVDSAGSGSIVTSAERAKLASITDTGSGSIISEAERAKISAITDTGSGVIITEAERSKLSAITDTGSGAIITAIERAQIADCFACNTYTEINTNTDLDGCKNYIVDTSAAPVAINIPFGQVKPFAVRDATKSFKDNNCIITIRDALNTIVHTATLDKKDKGYIFYNADGTANGWKYGEIGKGIVTPIASDHVASVDFGDLIEEDDAYTFDTLHGGACYDDPAKMMDVPGALASKQYVDENTSGIVINKMTIAPSATVESLDVSSLSPVGILFFNNPINIELRSLAGGVDGDIIHLVHGTLGDLKLKKSDSFPGQQLQMPNDADDTLTKYGGCSLIYNATAGYWFVTGLYY